MRIVAGFGAAAAILATAMAATGCGAHLTGSKPPPGHQAPANAMAGFIGNMLGDRPEAACRYEVPSLSGICALALAAEGRASGGWSIGDTATSGNRAIVDVEYANACMVGTCISNSNPAAGLPGSGLSFAAAFKQARQAQGFTLACLRVGGNWYVDTVQGG
jgi:hypothetical protein